MAKNKSNFKFLSQSVLLEEAELPWANTLIVLVVFVMVVSFIAWSLMMNIEQLVGVSGVVSQEPSGAANFTFRAQIPSKDIGVIKEGFSVVMNIPGVTQAQPLMGMVERIDKTPKTTQQGNVYFDMIIAPEKDMLKEVEPLLISGMETKVDIIVGSRTLFQYLVGPFFLQNKTI